MGNYRSLKVWEKAHQLTLLVYQVTAGFPIEEAYGLKSQMRRSAASIPTNIAEGCGRNSDRELARFCRISLGSANELEYQSLLAHDLGFLREEQYRATTRELQEVKRMLASFTSKLTSHS
jgi:four helix bundle protein